MSHERPVEPFSDLHVEHGRVRATLLHDPTVEGLDMAIYMDGSGSMREEYEPRRQSRTLWQWLAGEPAPLCPTRSSHRSDGCSNIWRPRTATACCVWPIGRAAIQAAMSKSSVI